MYIGVHFYPTATFVTGIHQRYWYRGVRKMTDIRNFIGFAQNETLIKEYDGLRMYFPVRAKIGIAVTNKRLIAYSTVRSFFNPRSESIYQHAAIADIKGVGVVQSARSRPAAVVLGVFLLLAGALATVIGLTGGSLPALGGGVACVILGIILVIAGLLWKKNLFRFEVWGNAWTLCIGEFDTIRPSVVSGPELLKVVEELGALIVEIQEGTLYTGE